MRTPLIALVLAAAPVVLAQSSRPANPPRERPPTPPTVPIYANPSTRPLVQQLSLPDAWKAYAVEQAPGVIMQMVYGPVRDKVTVMPPGAVEAVYLEDKDLTVLRAYVTWGGANEIGETLRREVRLQWTAKGKVKPEDKVNWKIDNHPGGGGFTEIDTAYVPERPEGWHDDPLWHTRPGHKPDPAAFLRDYPEYK